MWEKYEFEFQKQTEDEDSLEYNDGYEEEMFEFDAKDVPVVMQTPFGIFRVDDSMNPFKRFDFRMGHTNFNITQSIMDKIKSIP